MTCNIQSEAFTLQKCSFASLQFADDFASKEFKYLQEEMEKLTGDVRCVKIFPPKMNKQK